MSSCLSGGSGTYGFDLEMVKSVATSTRTSPTSSSPTSTISDSSNSPLAICTRKARTQRKRPNQTYNEAAALLSTAYPSVFSAMHLTNPRKSHRPHQTYSPDESSNLFLPFRVVDDESAVLLHHPSEERKPCFFRIAPKSPPSYERSCQVPDESEIQSKVLHFSDDYAEDFDAESLLDEEIEEGIIDSIMGKKSGSVETEKLNGESNVGRFGSSWYRNPMALLGLGGKLDICCGFRRPGVSAWRDVGEVNWWNFPTVDVHEISPKLNPNRTLNNYLAEKKKKKRVEKPQPSAAAAPAESESISNVKLSAKEDSSASFEEKKPGLILKLDYNNVLDAWSDRGSPFPDDSPASDNAGNDVAARLAQIDLFTEGGGMREASVQRYKEKRRTRLFSKKIRYQVRKVNADCRPRMKGRFVRRPISKLIKDIDDGNVTRPCCGK